jgi:hypothetical protein
MNMASTSGAAVNLLWTGGWDSTFQLLRLLLIYRRPVTPFYLMDPTRPSTQIELKTMQRIRDRLVKEYPQTGELLLPNRLFDVAELAADRQIDDAFNRIVKHSFMGNQYAWLARFCRQYAIADMELCIHRDDKAHAVVECFVSEKVQGDGYRTCRVDPAHAQTPQYTLFGAFSFPLLEVSKLDMAKIADEQGWKPIMAMTWFCHRPRRNQQPCGHCNPCLYTIEEGLGWRIPWSSRVTSSVYRIFVLPLKAPARAIIARLRGFHRD